MKKTNNGSTHWEGCYLDHSGCAKVKVEDLEKKVSTLRAALERLEWIGADDERYCSVCFHMKTEGHRDCCALKEALK